VSSYPLETLSVFTVRVWGTSFPSNQTVSSDNNNVALSNSKLLLETIVDLKNIEFVGYELKKISIPIQNNSILLEFFDGIYIPVQNLSTASDLEKIVSFYRKYQQMQEDTKKVSEKITNTLAECEQYHKRIQYRNLLQLRISRYGELKEQLQQFIGKERKKLETAHMKLTPRIRKTKQDTLALLANDALLEEHRKQLQTEKELLRKLTHYKENRKNFLIVRLSEIFPIAVSNSERPFSILGFALPNSDFSGYEEEQVSTALGFVCHAAFMISNYLEIPLRYTMIPMGSRSVIRDDISQQVSPKFPLYSRGVDRTRFEYGVFLLNKNLEQMMTTVGIKNVILRETLPNLYKLFQSFRILTKEKL